MSERTKRLAVYSIQYYPNIGGVEVTTRMLARNLSGLGYKVMVITEVYDHARSVTQEAFSVTRSRNPLRVGLLIAKSDLVIIKGGVSIKGGLISAILRKPFILVHEMAGGYRGEALGQIGRWKAFIRNYIVRRAYFHVGVSWACLRSKGLPKAQPQTVIYNAVDPELMHPPLPEKLQKWNSDILFVGRLIKSKGITLLADAMDEIERSDIFPELKLNIVGVGSEEASFRLRAKNWRRISVAFNGRLEGLALAAAYRATRMVVFPSTIPEGMGLVIAEAHYFGRPVLASSFPASAEIVGGGGLLFDSNNATELAETITAVLSDSALYDRLAAQAQQCAERFHPETYRQRWSELIAKCLHGPT